MNECGWRVEVVWSGGKDKTDLRLKGRRRKRRKELVWKKAGTKKEPNPSKGKSKNEMEVEETRNERVTEKSGEARHPHHAVQH